MCLNTELNKIYFLDEWNNDSSFIEVNTSGSTGKPKRIRLPKEMMIQSALETNNFFKITSDSTIYSLVSPEFIGGKLPFVRAILAKCLLETECPSNHPSLTSDLSLDFSHRGRNKSKKIDLISVVPSQIPYLIKNRKLFRPVNNYLIGGSFIPPKIQTIIFESGIKAWESYGMTETASHIGIRKVNAPGQEEPFTPMEDVIVSLDSRGCLIIERKGWEPVITNDIAQLYDGGRFKIIGRIDDVIITGGKKFHPAEMEKTAEELLPFKFMFKGKRDDKWGETISIVVELNSQETNVEFPSLELINALLESKFERWQLPKSIEIVESLPRTPNGKLKRR